MKVKVDGVKYMERRGIGKEDGREIVRNGGEG